MRRIDRREFLQQSGYAALQVGLATARFPPALLQSAYAVATSASRDTLQYQLGAEGTVLLPSHPRFSAYRATFNRRIEAPAPLAIVLCTSANAVAQAILWARQHQVPIRMRSGGHSYEGFSQGPGLVIDTRLMNTIVVDAQRGTATIGPGATLGDVYQTLYQYGFTIPAGSCPTVGIAGLALGGGYGFLSRKLGLACDQLLSLQIVTAEGKIVDANMSDHADLFWACRGAGGGSFGVATRFHFRLHPIGPVTTVHLRWPASQAHRALEAFQDWAPGVADELTCSLTLTATPAGVQQVELNGQFVGPPSNLPRLLLPLRAVGIPAKQIIVRCSFLEAVAQFAGHQPPSRSTLRRSRTSSPSR
jgi:FAD/FMN-containing dehydrogenase